MTDDVLTADPVIAIVHGVLQVILHTGGADMAHLGIPHMMTEVMDGIGRCLLIIESGIGRCLLITEGGMGLSRHMVGGIGLSLHMVEGIGHSRLTVGGIGQYPLTVGGTEQHHHIQGVIDQCLLQILPIGVPTDPEIYIPVGRVYLEYGSG